MKNILIFTGWVIVFIAVFFAVVTIYGNATRFGDPRPPDLPNLESPYYEIVMSTGQTLYTETYREEKGVSIIHHLSGFYQLEENKYKYHKGDLSLSEAVFGRIKVTRR